MTKMFEFLFNLAVFTLADANGAAYSATKVESYKWSWKFYSSTFLYSAKLKKIIQIWAMHRTEQVVLQ